MFSKERITDPRLTGVAWLMARLWVGWQFLDIGREKVSGPDRAVWIGDQAGLAVRGFLTHALDVAPGGALAGEHPEVQGWYAAVIRQALLPNAELFSYLVTFGELLVGVALIVGVLTRFAAAMGLVMNVAYLLAGANDAGPLMVLLELPLLLVGAAAGFYGVDRYLMPFLRGRFGRLVGTLPRQVRNRQSLQTG